MAMELLFVGVGAVAHWIYNKGKANKFGKLNELIQAIQKRKEIIFLESEGAVNFRIIDRSHQNIAFTKEHDIIVLTENSLKACANLNGVKIGHGDLYRSVVVPTDFSKFTEHLKESGLTDTQITEIYTSIMNKNITQLTKQKQKDIDTAKNALIKKYPEEEYIPKDNENIPYDVFILNHLAKKQETLLSSITLNTFKSMSSVVKNFIQTGVNRVSLHSMMEAQTAIDNFKKAGQRDWYQILLGIGILALMVGLAFSFAGPFIPDMISAATASSSGVSAIIP